MKRAHGLSIGAVAAACLAWSGSVAAQGSSVTGATLVERCQSSEPTNNSWCVGFITGIGAVVSDPTIEAKYRVCFPAELTSDIGRLVVLRHVEQTAALLDVSGHHAVWYALRKEFACS
jgi:hypothetical protein